MESRNLVSNIIRGDYDGVIENLLSHDTIEALKAELTTIYEFKSILYLAIERWLFISNFKGSTELEHKMVDIIHALVAFGANDIKAKRYLYEIFHTREIQARINEKISDYFAENSSKIPLYRAVTKLWKSLQPTPAKLERYFKVAFIGSIHPQRDTRLTPWHDLRTLVTTTHDSNGNPFVLPKVSFSDRKIITHVSRQSSQERLASEVEPTVTLACSSTTFSVRDVRHREAVSRRTSQHSRTSSPAPA